MPRARLLWTLIVIGACCALAALYPRVQLERATRGVDVLIDYYALRDLCDSEGLDPATMLETLKQAGATAVAYPENTLDRLISSGQVSLHNGADLGRLLVNGGTGLPRTDMRPDVAKTYMVVYEPQVLADLKTWAPFFLGSKRFRTWPAAADRTVPSERQGVILELATSAQALEGAGMGFSKGDVQLAQKAGLNVYLRPQNRPHFQDADVLGFFNAIAQLRPRGIIFEGASNEVVGYPDSLDATEKAIRTHGLLFGNIEVAVVEAAQKGSQTLGRKLDDLTVRVMSMPALQQARMSPDEAIDRYRLGARERNMRIAYLRFFNHPETGKTVLKTNLDYVSDLRDTLARSGFRFMGAQAFPDIGVAPWWLVGMTLGAAAAGVLFLELFLGVSDRLSWLILIGTPVLAGLSILAHKGNLVSTGMALEAALVFSVLGLAYGIPALIRESQEAPSAWAALTRAILPLVLVTGVGLVGGLYVAGLMSGTTFMLAVDQFRGIKLIMVCAPALVVLLYLTRYAPNRESTVELLNKRVVFWHIAAVAVLGAVAAFYVARTGNASPAAASDYERYVRDFLENTLVVRPRFKEFALGHPAWFVMAALLWRRRAHAWMWLLALAAAIGQVDVVDTFAHAHTPYMVSVVRVFIGLALGIVIGLPLAGLVAHMTPEGFPSEMGRSTDTEYPPAPVRLDSGSVGADDTLQKR